jgi:lysophospholipase L1-like esterase
VSVDQYPSGPPRLVRTLAVLGDSIGVGIGDPAIGGGWRGFAPLLAAALGDPDLVNVSANGARVRALRVRQLPTVVAARPDAAIVLAGMNDTLRSDFNARAIAADFDKVVGTLSGMGAVVVMVRYHDHGRVFRLPGPLHRALARRIDALNAAIDEVALRYDAGVVDLGALPGTYLARAWSVDRLHPSEWGHRMLARALSDQLAEDGVRVAAEVSPRCAGSARISTLDRLLWLTVKGLPWVFSRGFDLVPYLLQALTEAMLRPDGIFAVEPVQVERAAMRANRRGVGQRTS